MGAARQYIAANHDQKPRRDFAESLLQVRSEAPELRRQRKVLRRGSQHPQ